MPWFKFQHNCPDNGLKKASGTPPGHPVIHQLIKGDQVVPAVLFLITFADLHETRDRLLTFYASFAPY